MCIKLDVVFFFFFDFFSLMLNMNHFFFYIKIIVIITLLQEDNKFGTDASLTYGPQIQRRLITTDSTKIIYIMYISNPTPLERGWGGVRFMQAQNQQMLLHVVREW